MLSSDPCIFDHLGLLVRLALSLLPGSLLSRKLFLLGLEAGSVLLGDPLTILSRLQLTLMFESLCLKSGSFGVSRAARLGSCDLSLPLCVLTGSFLGHSDEFKPLGIIHARLLMSSLGVCFCFLCLIALFFNARGFQGSLTLSLLQSYSISFALLGFVDRGLLCDEPGLHFFFLPDPRSSEDSESGGLLPLELDPSSLLSRSFLGDLTLVFQSGSLLSLELQLGGLLSLLLQLCSPLSHLSLVLLTGGLLRPALSLEPFLIATQGLLPLPFKPSLGLSSDPSLLLPLVLKTGCLLSRSLLSGASLRLLALILDPRRFLSFPLELGSPFSGNPGCFLFFVLDACGFLGSSLLSSQSFSLQSSGFLSCDPGSLFPLPFQFSFLLSDPRRHLSFILEASGFLRCASFFSCQALLF